MRFLAPLAICAMTLSSAGHASQSTAGSPTYVYGMSSGVIIFNQSGGPRISLPACASGNPDRWAFDANSAAGQNRLSILLTAKALGKSVQVYGTNSCSTWGDTETVDFLAMNE